MQYRNFGKINFKTSALGFGVMRLPVFEGNSGNIDEEEAKKMLYFAIENGVNYLDTAYVYHQGNSEVFLGKVLKNTRRKKVKIATKLPVWMVESKNDLDKFLNEQLQRLQTDNIDFYLLHALNKDKWKKVLKFGILSWAEKKISQGKINYLGFSFHDQYSLFQKIIDYYSKWTFCQIQYNFLDEDIQAGKKGLEYASQKGLAVVVMEPLKGGKLAHPPQPVLDILQESKIKRTPVDWALQWLWNQPGVSLVLSGMNTFDQVKQNIRSANLSTTNLLSEEELKVIQKIKDKYIQIAPVPCTNCQYCLPCPQKVNIPKIFELYNSAVIFKTLNESINQYQSLPPEEKAGNCINCGKCEKLCPQKIKIAEELKKAETVLRSSDNK